LCRADAGEVEAEAEERTALCASQSASGMAKSSGPERPRLWQRSWTSPPPSPLPPMRKLLTRSSEQAAEPASEAGPDAGAEAGCGYGAAAVAAEAAPRGAAAARRRRRGVLRAGERAHRRRPQLMGRPAGHGRWTGKREQREAGEEEQRVPSMEGGAGEGGRLARCGREEWERAGKRDLKNLTYGVHWC